MEVIVRGGREYPESVHVHTRKKKFKNQCWAVYVLYGRPLMVILTHFVPNVFSNASSLYKWRGESASQHYAVRVLYTYFVQPKSSNSALLTLISVFVISSVSILSCSSLQICIIRKWFSLLPVIVERIYVLNQFSVEKLFSECIICC